jgi:hypothetical protein
LDDVTRDAGNEKPVCWPLRCSRQKNRIWVCPGVNEIRSRIRSMLGEVGPVTVIDLEWVVGVEG